MDWENIDCCLYPVVGLETDVVGLVQCTSPFVRVEDLEIACQKMTAEGFDSVFSVCRSHSLRWVENDSGTVVQINCDPAEFS